MKKILTIISSVLISFSAFAAEDKIIIENVDVTEVVNANKSDKWGKILQYTTTNKELIKNQINKIDFKTKTFTYSSVNPIYKAVIAAYYNISEDKDWISESNAIELIPGTFFSHNLDKYEEHKQNGFKNWRPVKVLMIATRLKDWETAKKYKKYITIYNITKQYNIYKNILSDEEIFEKLQENAETLTDEQIKFKNTLFVKLYQKKMLGK